MRCFSFLLLRSLSFSSLFCSPDCAAEYSIVVAMECTQRRPETSPRSLARFSPLIEKSKILTLREKKVSFHHFFLSNSLTFFSLFFFSKPRQNQRS